MPFDGVDQEMIYRARRQAAAEFLRAVPANVFCLHTWSRCAMGWMAREGFDGWHFYNGKPTSGDGWMGFSGARRYFGLSEYQTDCVFGARPREARWFYRKWFFQKVKPADVAQALLDAPYVAVAVR